jgi:hypothetical protein
MSKSEEIKEKLKNLITGKYSGDFLRKRLGPLSLVIFAVFIGISWILYPNYNFIQMDVSYLGHPERNPLGWIFWSFGLVLTGIIMLSITGYIYQRLSSIFGIHTKIGVLFFYLSSIGMILLGSIPQGQAEIVKTLHVVHAVFAFGGLYLGTWTFCIHMLKKEEFKKKARVMTVLAFGVTIGLALTQIISILAFPESSQIPWILEFSLWEWLLLFGIFGAFVILLFNLPKDEEE